MNPVRTSILKILYQEGARDPLLALDREEIIDRLDISWDELQVEVNYLTEKGYIVIKKRQIRSRIYSSLYLTAAGVDHIEKEEGGEVERLRQQLLKRQANLQYLEEQAAQYGARQIPLHLHNQIELERQEIETIEARLRELEGT